MAGLVVPLLILTFATSQSFASDADPLQDFCVADIALGSTIPINGFVCKNSSQVVSPDFMSPLLSKPGNTSNSLGSSVNLVSVLKFPGLNAQGMSFARLDFAPNGLNPEHLHPRATEVLFLVQGTLQAGFVTSTTNKTLYEQTLHAGDLFIFPRALVHFQFNPDFENPATAISGFNSQNPGRIDVILTPYLASRTRTWKRRSAYNRRRQTV